MSSEIENYMTSSQRLFNYSQLESEDSLYKEADINLESEWPSKGIVEFKNVTMRYRESLEPSIRNLSMVIQPKMKVGIVGRTGAGKSSILQALFRLCEIEQGTITLDGVDIRHVGLHTLRKSLAFIPQAPFLLQGTIRENLDPFNEKTDEEVWTVLKEVKLDLHIEGMKDGLLTEVAESNNLFSVG